MTDTAMVPQADATDPMEKYRDLLRAVAVSILSDGTPPTQFPLTLQEELKAAGIRWTDLMRDADRAKREAFVNFIRKHTEEEIVALFGDSPAIMASYEAIKDLTDAPVAPLTDQSERTDTTHGTQEASIL